MSTPLNPDPTDLAPAPPGDPAAPLAGDTNDVVILGHRYDGIREYDNPMPGWWTWLFIVTVLVSPVYVLGVHVWGFIDDYEGDLAEGQAQLETLREAYAATGPAFATDPRALADHAADPAMAAAGAPIYTANCAACHGDAGQGLIGPNLADAYWIHGGRPEDVFRVVTEGVAAQGMPPWASVLTDEQRAQLVAHIAALQGTDPPNAKPPQGEPSGG